MASRSGARFVQHSKIQYNGSTATVDWEQEAGFGEGSGFQESKLSSPNANYSRTLNDLSTIGFGHSGMPVRGNVSGGIGFGGGGGGRGSPTRRQGAKIVPVGSSDGPTTGNSPTRRGHGFHTSELTSPGFDPLQERSRPRRGSKEDHMELVLAHDFSAPGKKPPKMQTVSPTKRGKLEKTYAVGSSFNSVGGTSVEGRGEGEFGQSMSVSVTNLNAPAGGGGGGATTAVVSGLPHAEPGRDWSDAVEYVLHETERQVQQQRQRRTLNRRQSSRSKGEKPSEVPPLPTSPKSKPSPGVSTGVVTSPRSQLSSARTMSFKITEETVKTVVAEKQAPFGQRRRVPKKDDTCMLVQLYRNWKEQRAKRKALAKQLFTLLNGTLLFDGPSGHMVAMCGITKKQLHDLAEMFYVELVLDARGCVTVWSFLDWVGLPDSTFNRSMFKVFSSNLTLSGDMRSFEDFIVALITMCIFTRQDMLRMLFNTIDADTSGYVDEKEYLALLLMMAGGEGNAFPGSFEKVLEVADINMDGRVTFAEFLELARRFPLAMFPLYQFQIHLQDATLGAQGWMKIKQRVEFMMENSTGASGKGNSKVAPAPE